VFRILLYIFLRLLSIVLLVLAAGRTITRGFIFRTIARYTFTRTTSRSCRVLARQRSRLSLALPLFSWQPTTTILTRLLRRRKKQRLEGIRRESSCFPLRPLRLRASSRALETSLPFAPFCIARYPRYSPFLLSRRARRALSVAASALKMYQSHRRARCFAEE